MLGDPELKKCKEGDIIELQRRGFFRVDRAYAPPSAHTGKATPVILFEIPDGRPKDRAAPAHAVATSAQQKQPSVANDAGDDLSAKIAKQGNVVRDLKSQKAEKVKIEPEVKALLALKAEYKAKHGKDWTPSAAPVATPLAASGADALNDSITKQGNTVRDLKAKKADKAQVDAAVKALLALKADFKAQTGKDWTPNAAPATPAAPAPKHINNVDALNENISKQGNIVRDLKAKKADKAQIDEAIKVLLALKADYRSQTGKDWTPSVAPPAASGADALSASITQQGNTVRDLKAQKAGKAQVDAAVKALLALKADFKAQTGKDWTPQPAGIAQPKAGGGGDDLNDRIAQQGNVVRDLKAKKAGKAQVEPEVAKLLALKAEYKTKHGKDWAPGATPAPGKVRITRFSSNRFFFY